MTMSEHGGARLSTTTTTRPSGLCLHLYVMDKMNARVPGGTDSLRPCCPGWQEQGEEATCQRFGAQPYGKVTESMPCAKEPGQGARTTLRVEPPGLAPTA